MPLENNINIFFIISPFCEYLSAFSLLHKAFKMFLNVFVFLYSFLSSKVYNYSLDDEYDSSGVKIRLTKYEPQFVASIYLFASNFQIPPHSKGQFCIQVVVFNMCNASVLWNPKLKANPQIIFYDYYNWASKFQKKVLWKVKPLS